MIVDFSLNLIVRNHKLSKLCSRLADFIFPRSIKTYRILIGPGRNLKFRLNARNQTSILFGTYERANVNFLLTCVSDKTIFWDIGANIGYFTCIVSRVVPKACVVCVEPFPDNVQLLQEHIHLNNLKNVIIIKKALSSYEGLALFLITQGVSEGRIVNNREILPAKTINVPVTTIDALVNSGLPAPDILKVDAEGEEGCILSGAASVLKKHRPYFLIDVHNPEAAQACWDILYSYGYNIYFLEGSSLKKPEKLQDICGGSIWAEPIK